MARIFRFCSTWMRRGELSSGRVRSPCPLLRTRAPEVAAASAAPINVRDQEQGATGRPRARARSRPRSIVRRSHVSQKGSDATERLSMRQIREILRQKWCLGQSCRAVAESLHACVNIDYRVELHGHYYSVSHALLHELVDARLSPPPHHPPIAPTCTPSGASPGFTLELLHSEYLEQHPDRPALRPLPAGAFIIGEWKYEGRPIPGHPPQGARSPAAGAAAAFGSWRRPGRSNSSRPR